MNKKYVLGMEYPIKEAFKNKALLEKMLPDCTVGIVFVNKNPQNCTLYLELKENRIFTPSNTE